MNGIKIKSFFYGVLVAAIFFIVIPLFLIFINNFFYLPIYLNYYFKIIGYLFFIIGLFLVFYFSVVHMKTGRATPLPVIEQPKKFIAKGFYKYCRNPMYLSDLLVFLGVFLILGHLLLLVYFLISFPVIYLFVVYVEEPELRRVFGKEYIEYTKKVPRWIPKLSS